jgi:hypothetical protein
MCDYSLHHVASRPAKVGDKLTTRDFGTGTRGFAASFFLVRQVRADPVGHDHNERAIIHIQPVGTADELIIPISYEWAVDILA